MTHAIFAKIHFTNIETQQITHRLIFLSALSIQHLNLQMKFCFRWCALWHTPYNDSRHLKHSKIKRWSKFLLPQLRICVICVTDISLHFLISVHQDILLLISSHAATLKSCKNWKSKYTKNAPLAQPWTWYNYETKLHSYLVLRWLSISA